MSLPIVLALSCWAKSSAKHKTYTDTIMKMPHTGAQACKSADDNQSRSRQIWHFLRAVPIFYWVVMPSCILNEDEPLYMRISHYKCCFSANNLWQYIFHTASKHIQHYSTPMLLSQLQTTNKRMYLLCLGVIHFQ